MPARPDRYRPVRLPLATMLLAGALLVLVAPVGDAGAAVARDTWTLTIGIVDDPADSSPPPGPDVLQAAAIEATRIWARHDVRLRWVSAHGDLYAQPPCGIRLSVSNRPIHSQGGWTWPLGAIRFAGGREPRAEVVVSTARLPEMTARIRLGDRPFSALPAKLRRTVMARILGRTAAHEIGHYLLASPGHTDRGLMRATFAHGEFLDAGLWRYAIDPRERLLLARNPRLAGCRDGPPEVAAR